jgi:hypothetical protein
MTSDFARGIERAATWVDQRRFDFEAENGSIDPDTGAMEFGRGLHAELKQDYADELAEIADGIRSLSTAAQVEAQPVVTDEQRSAASLFTCWWAMIEAEAQIAEDPIKDNAVVFRFMGSGASCMVMAKDIRAVCALLSHQPAVSKDAEGAK